MTEAAAPAQSQDESDALGLIAGSGALPRLIVEDRRSRGLRTFVVRYAGVCAPWADGFPHADLPFERPGDLFTALRRAGAGAICFAGAMRRPWLNPFRFDRTAWGLLSKVPPLLLKRDDAMLRGFAALLEAEGFRVVAAHEQLETLLAPDGVLSRFHPDDAALSDAALAARAAATLGRDDLGQAAVAANGRILAREGRQGTDAMLADLAASKRAGGGVLHKAPKPGQDWRLDLPAIGPQTLRKAAAAGLAGVSVQAGGVLILGRDETTAAADQAGLFLWGRPRTAEEDAL
ncbi:MAG: UDP-2,3-diacylglucosamine diphosphatase LpxI [Pseudomonadota bacterium]